MKRSIYKKSAGDLLRSALLPIIFSLAIMGMIVFGLRQTELSSRAEGYRVLRESVLRAAVKCYAVEGRYPDNISYIEDNYGVHIDWSKYTVFYEIVASNLFPEITVIELMRD